MKPDYLYLITVVNEETQEFFQIEAHGDRERLLAENRMPDHHTVVSVENKGVTIPAVDYVQKLTDEGDLNFGSH